MERKINRIKVALVEKGKTNKWLAERVGKDPATVSKWCTNAAQPILEMLMQISKILDTPLDALVRFEELPEIEKNYKSCIFQRDSMIWESPIAILQANL